MPGLPQPLFDAVAKQILPYVQNEGERRAWLAGQLNQDPVFQRINWSGSAQPFAVHVIETLSHDQLVTALRRLPAGAEQRPSIESLCDEIAALKPAPTGSPTDPLRPERALRNTAQAPNLPNPFYAKSREPLGREEEILRIEAKLQAGAHCAIVGPMGSGKSLLLEAIQDKSPSWLRCQPRQVLYIDVQGTSSLIGLQRDVVMPLGGLKPNEWRVVVSKARLRLLLLDNLGAMDPGARGLAMRHWLRGLEGVAGTKLLMASNQRLEIVFYRDDPNSYSTLAGLDGSPIQLDPLSIETCRRIVALRLKDTGLDPASFSDLFQSARHAQDLLDAGVARYDALVNPRR